jgi:hypothetical protein
MKEVERIRRWPFAYGTAQQQTIAGTATYAIPAGILTISNLYYLDTNGQPQIIENYSAMELRRTYGEGAGATGGPPRKYSILGTNIEIFPTPDFTGPSAGNYTLLFEGYQSLLPIVETTGSIGATANLLTVPSTGYLAGFGINGFTLNSLSIRGAGYPQSAAFNDQLITLNSGVAPPAGVITGLSAQTTVTAAQTFFNSVNWLMTDYPKVLEFAVMREVATYLKENYDTWETRYQHELDLMADHAVDRQTNLESMATWSPGQRTPQLRRLDSWMTFEYRGGVL